MNLRHIRLIAGRELRDQLRDRRMVFLFIVLPVLMYPLLGMSMFQMQQFIRETTTSVAVLGAEHLPDVPPLLEGELFARDLFREPPGWEPSEDPAEIADPEKAVTRRQNRLKAVAIQAAPEPHAQRASKLLDEHDVVLVIPAGFKERLAAFQDALRSRQDGNDPERPPAPELYYDSSNERSQTTKTRVSYILSKWTEETVRVGFGINKAPRVSFALEERDQAKAGHEGVAVWSRIFPFLFIIWALTGAFQPAVDLCAGEKERGTLETLLVSPAARRDLVAGKLLAIAFFSAATVIINTLSLGVTGHLLLSKIRALGTPPTIALLWLLLALPPLSIFFSALCLGLSAFARSAKEGNYYMVPLFLLLMPMMMAVMTPSADLTVGKSVIPIMGLALVLRVLIEGDYATALPHVIPVVVVTVLCAVVATRWAVSLFNREAVLFRESERLDLGLWITATWRDRGPLPTPAAALGCALTIMLLRFFTTLAIPAPRDFSTFALQNSIAMVVVMVIPAVAMAYGLTRRPVESLRLRRPAWVSLPLAALLAVAVHPVLIELRGLVEWMYPVDRTALEAFEALLKEANIWTAIVALALVPAVCEELAFRGFILTGLEPAGRWTAILVSSFFFGIVHFLLQQSILAGILGILLALVALSTRSLWPCMVYHFCHNSLAMLIPTWLTAQAHTKTALGEWLLRPGSAEPAQLAFRWPVVAAALAAITLIGWLLSRSPAPGSAELTLAPPSE